MSTKIENQIGENAAELGIRYTETRAAAEITDLDDLLCALRSRQVPLVDDLPTFGGDEPRDTREIWSWDAERLLVGTCPGDLEIVDRPVRGQVPTICAACGHDAIGPESGLCLACAGVLS